MTETPAPVVNAETVTVTVPADVLADLIAAADPAVKYPQGGPSMRGGLDAHIATARAKLAAAKRARLATDLEYLDIFAGTNLSSIGDHVTPTTVALRVIERITEMELAVGHQLEPRTVVELGAAYGCSLVVDALATWPTLDKTDPRVMTVRMAAADLVDAWLARRPQTAGRLADAIEAATGPRFEELLDDAEPAPPARELTADELAAQAEEDSLAVDDDDDDDDEDEHERDHAIERAGGDRVDRRTCQMIGCPYGDEGEGR